MRKNFLMKNSAFKKMLSVALALTIAASGIALTTQTSNAASKVKVGKVNTVMVKTSGQNKLKVTWKKSGKVSSYRVYQAIGTSKTYKLVKKTTSKSYTTKALAKDKTYKFKVRPMYKGKAGKLSYSVTSRTANSKKKNVTKLVFRNYCKNMTTERVCDGKQVAMFSVTHYFPEIIGDFDKVKNTSKIVSYNVRWYTNNPKVLKVTNAAHGNGFIKPLKNGTAYVYAKAHNGITLKVKVTVKDKSKLTTDEIHEQASLIGLAQCLEYSLKYEQ